MSMTYILSSFVLKALFCKTAKQWSSVSWQITIQSSFLAKSVPLLKWLQTSLPQRCRVNRQVRMWAPLTKVEMQVHKLMNILLLRLQQHHQHQHQWRHYQKINQSREYYHHHHHHRSHKYSQHPTPRLIIPLYDGNYLSLCSPPFHPRWLMRLWRWGLVIGQWWRWRYVPPSWIRIELFSTCAMAFLMRRFGRCHKYYHEFRSNKGNNTHRWVMCHQARCNRLRVWLSRVQAIIKVQVYLTPAHLPQPPWQILLLVLVVVVLLE